MKKKRRSDPLPGGSPATSLRLDQGLKLRAQRLALDNRSAKADKDRSLTEILNNALAEYLKKRGA